MKSVVSSIVIWLTISLSGFQVHAQVKTNDKIGSTPARPNIIIILADDLGYHDVSYYGTPDVRTPNIDQLCKDGMRFDRFYANSPVCAPTRASLLSGRNPEMVGVPGLIRSNAWENFGYLKPGTVLLPQLLKKVNYNTALVGKWNLGLAPPNEPNDKGFDYFHGFLDDMMDDYYTHLRYGRNYLRENKKVITPEGHATDIFTDWANKYIQDQKNKKDPFFLYLAYNAPHSPMQPKLDWLAKVQKREPQLSIKRSKLVALIEHLDDGIGKLVETLKQTGQYDNTLIMFLSDNGGFLGDQANNGPLRDGKGTMYEGGIRIPGFMVWPHHIKVGSVSNERVMTMDILPTISEITGAKMENTIDGLSLLPIIKDQNAQLQERDLFFHRREGGKFGGQTIQAVISKGFKFLQNKPDEPYELYNLLEDPGEKSNIIKTAPKEFARLQALMLQQIQRGGSVPWQKPLDGN